MTSLLPPLNLPGVTGPGQAAHPHAPEARAVLTIEHLGVRLAPRRGAGAAVLAVQDVSLTLRAGQVTVLVGESGSGKSTLASALIGLLPTRASIRGRALLTATANQPPIDLLAATEQVHATAVRGRRVAFVPQSVATHLTPVRTALSQLVETVETLEPGATDPRRRALELAHTVGLDATDLGRYPHALSGGMAQRVAIAMALAGDPQVIVADELTAGLDRALADRALDTLRMLANQGRSVLLVTHDLAAAGRAADELAVLYAGRLVEVGPALEVLTDPWHEYTAALLAALPENGFTSIPGDPVQVVDGATGCAFHDRVDGVCDGSPARALGRRHVACGQGAC